MKFYHTSALYNTFIACFWFNAGDWKLVPGPFMIYQKENMAKSGHFS